MRLGGNNVEVTMRMRKAEKTGRTGTGGALVGAALIGAALIASGCTSLDSVVGDLAGRAVGGAVERRIEGMYAGYTDSMLFQLAYIQAFYLGGYGFSTDNFAEGEGTTWRVDSRDGGETSTMTAERALLQRLDNGQSWWYLKYTAEGEAPLEYEFLIDQDMQAREMYLRDPETGQVRHHVFEYDESGEPTDGTIEEDDPYGETVYVQNWEEYRQDRVTIRVGAGTFETDLLVHTIVDEETGESIEYRWWVTETVPGDLVQYEFEDMEDGGTVRGELMEVRQNYRFRLK
jgi:hypothetical protein